MVERAVADLVFAAREQALLLDKPRRGGREGAAKVQREEGPGAQRRGQLSPKEVEHWQSTRWIRGQSICRSVGPGFEWRSVTEHVAAEVPWVHVAEATRD